VLTLPGPVTATATSKLGATVTFRPPTATDTVDGTRPVACLRPSGAAALSGAVYPLGTTVVTCSATNSLGETASGSFTVTVTYSWSGFRAPLNVSPYTLSVRLPVVLARFALTGASAGIVNADATLRYAPISAAGVVGPSQLAAGRLTPLARFVYIGVLHEYDYLWDASALTKGAYQLQLVLGDGVARTTKLIVN
jgi:hypothetical protein